MAKQPETRLQQRIQKAIRKKYPRVFLFKHWGGPFSPAGIPDLIICLPCLDGNRLIGLFVALEVKLPQDRSKTSKIQDETLADIQFAGGVARVVRSVEEAMDILEETLDDY